MTMHLQGETKWLRIHKHTHTHTVYTPTVLKGDRCFTQLMSGPLFFKETKTKLKILFKCPFYII